MQFAIFSAFLFVLYGISFSSSIRSFKTFSGLEGNNRLVQQASDPKDQFFEQKLDHFNKKDGRKWKQVNYHLVRYSLLARVDLNMFKMCLKVFKNHENYIFNFYFYTTRKSCHDFI